MFSKFENKILSGYLSKDVEVKYFESGKIKSSFSFPLQDNKDTEPLWINGEAWDTLAEKIAEKKKGERFTGIGRIKEEEYEGKKRYKFVIIAVI
jgi:single-stranded DNA-binding protein